MKPVQRIILFVFVVWALGLLSGCREGAPPAGPSAAVPTAAVPTLVPRAATVRAAPTATPAPACENKDIPRITVDQLWRRLQAGEAIVVIDARSRDEYDIEHIAGAINVPQGEFSARAGELPQDRLLVFYCT